MPPIFQAQRTGTVAFAPNAPFLATGSFSGAVDASFSTDSSLQIYSVDFASSSGGQLQRAGGSVKVSESFERITWGAIGLNPASYPSGLIAGGLADGTIGVWSADKVLDASEDAEDVPDALLTTLSGHSGPVRGLDFNPNASNLLASGAADGETLVWDLTNPQAPNSFKVGGSSSSGMNSRGAARPEVGAVAWNWRFPKILACGLSNGTCVLWDLSKDKPRPVVSLRHPAGQRRVSVLQWSPGDPWNLMVGSDDDLSPELQLWDLRNQRAPKATLHGHSGGVLGLSWCQQDAAFLLSSGKDNRTIVWDADAGQELLELPRSGGCNFNAAWSPTVPGVFATASFDGKVSIYGVETAAQPDTASAAGGDFAALLSTQSTQGPPKQLARVPAWLKRPVSAHLGFAGKLATVTNSKKGEEPDAPVTAQLAVKQVITEEGLVQASEEFSAAAHGDRPTLRDFCAARAEAAAKAAEAAVSDDDKADARAEAETWTFLRILFEDNASEELLKHLGFEDMLPPPPPATPSGEGSLAGTEDTLGQISLQDGGSPTGGQQDVSPAAPIASAQSGEDFFSALGGADGGEMLQGFRTFSRMSVVTGPAAAEMAAEAGPGEKAIQRALYAGNFSAAVDAALEAERYADALGIAALPGAAPELFTRAQKAYMAAAPRPYMLLARCIMDQDFRALIGAQPLTSWKETLATLATYATNDTWQGLAQGLAERLAQHHRIEEATLCWVAAGCVDDAVAAWTSHVNGQTASVEKLQALAERTVMLGIATSTQGAAPAAGAVIARYASLLAAQGRLHTALAYLDMAPGEGALDTAVLRDRIYRAGGPELAASAPAPPFPFVAEEVAPSPSTQAPQQAAAANGTYGGYGQQQQQQPQAQPPAAESGFQSAYGKPAAATPAFAAAGSTGWSQPAAAAAPSAYGASAYGGRAANGPGLVPPPPVQQPAVPQRAPPQQPAFAPVASSAAYAPAAPMMPSAGYGTQQQQAPPPPPGPAAPQPSMFVPSAPQPHQQPPAPAYAPPQPQKPAFAHSASAYKPAAQPAYQQHAGAPPAASAAPYIPGHPSAAGSPSQGAYRAPSAAAMPPGVFVPSSTAASPRHGPPGALQPGGFGGPPGGAPMQQQAAPPQPVAPPAPVGPPPGTNISTVDTSKVAADMQPVVAALGQLFAGVAAAQGGQPAKKRELDDSSKRLGVLFWHLNTQDVSEPVQQELQQLAAALTAGDGSAAKRVQVGLTTTAWTECSQWLTALKRLLKAQYG